MIHRATIAAVVVVIRARALVAANGQRLPITLDQSGRLVDGRNRLAACQRVAVEPAFETVEFAGEVS